MSKGSGEKPFRPPTPAKLRRLDPTRGLGPVFAAQRQGSGPTGSVGRGARTRQGGVGPGLEPVFGLGPGPGPGPGPEPEPEPEPEPGRRESSGRGTEEVVAAAAVPPGGLEEQRGNSSVERLETSREVMEGLENDVRDAKGMEASAGQPGATQEGLGITVRDLGTTEEGLEATKEGLGTTVRDLGAPREKPEATKGARKGLGTIMEGLETTKEALESTRENLDNTKEGLGTTTLAKRILETISEVSESLETTVGDPETTKEGQETSLGFLEIAEGAKKGLETTNGQKENLETTNGQKENLETTISCFVEDRRSSKEDNLETISKVEGTLGTLKVKPSTRHKRKSLKTITQCLQQVKRGLETTNGHQESLKTSPEVTGNQQTTTNGHLETTSEAKGSLETTNRRKRSLKATIRRSMESLETTTSSSLEEDREEKESLASTTETKRSMKTTSSSSLEQERSRKSNLGSTTEALECLETTTTAMMSLKPAKENVETTTSKARMSLKPTSKARMSLKPTSKARMILKPSRELLESLEPTKENMEPPRELLDCLEASSQSQAGAQQQVVSSSPERCSVISVDDDDEEEEEEEVEAEDEEEGGGGPHHLLVALEAVQQQLEVVEEEASRAFRRLRAKFQRQRRPHLRRRSRLIRSIPGFWVTSFLNHPQLSAIITDRDEDALSYMTSLEVEDFAPSSLGCRIRFFFNPNPYFQNQEVTKEFSPGPSGHLVSSSTPIRWWQGQDPPGAAASSPQSFFSWFGDHSSPGRDHIAQIIKEQLWPNPLQFYLGGALERTPESESGEDSVVILDDDEDLEEGSSIEEVPD